MTKAYSGSCHCGSVRFKAEVDLAQGTSRCNCSICTKSRFWKAVIASDAFTLTAGEDQIGQYRFGSETIIHCFCTRCGVKPFGRVEMGEHGSFVAINVACLDQLSPEDFSALPIAYENGREDDWDNAPIPTAYL
ncbi:GFA family protein [Pelagibacterium lentulum]|uniref:Aldehyde-activating protein n=1 Tax=Pelagibacterium lentulum TaxID=2029865 RepID=A0A916REC4_9HYPH|nr:GFA family protein [Pelagibacterium lentulum]GGA53998.1 aldehyde-activating protein [Pelagibacterium lentulum]